MQIGAISVDGHSKRESHGNGHSAGKYRREKEAKKDAQKERAVGSAWTC
jgi:hypothetical protein